jgi:signal peptidase II
MAFGITFGWEYGKLLLSLFRILMVAGLIWYMRMLLLARVSMGFVYSVGLITAGALGNIIDSAFYGLIFTESPVHQEGVVAQLVPPGQGYGTFLHGRVVDMLYFPMKWITMPDWVPWLGGEQYLFFSPIFNIADTAITTGVLTILLFQRRFFRDSIQTDPPPALVTVTSDHPLEAADPADPENPHGVETPSENGNPSGVEELPASTEGKPSP